MIRYKNYFLEPDGGRFNLTKEKMIPESRDEKTGIVTPAHPTIINMGFSMKFETCLHEIISDILEQNGDIESIPEYIEQYKKERNRILDCLK